MYISPSEHRHLQKEAPQKGPKRSYRNEYLFIRGIDKTCEKFVKKLDEEENEFNSPQANKLMFYFNKFLKAQEIEYLNVISELEFKEKDVKFIRSL